MKEPIVISEHHPKATPQVITGELLMSYLHGLTTIDGRSFGELNPHYLGIYWWRRHLHLLEPIPTYAPPPDDNTKGELMAWLLTQISAHRTGPTRNDPYVQAHVARLTRWLEILDDCPF